MISSQGILNYDGKWCLVECDYNLGRYLRKLFLLGHGIKLQRPARSEHITVVSHHEQVSKNWQIRNGELINFDLHTCLYTNGNAFWYPAWSQQLFTLREQLGLGCPPIPLHFCIGYIKENEDD